MGQTDLSVRCIFIKSRTERIRELLESSMTDPIRHEEIGTHVFAHRKVIEIAWQRDRAVSRTQNAV